MSSESQSPLQWHRLTGQEVCRQLSVDPAQGLSDESAQRRLEQHGPNRIREQARRPLWRLFLEQFTDFMILVLIIAAAISGLVGEPVDAIAILVIVALNAFVGFVQEYRAERAVAALREMAAPSARVRRGGGTLEVATTELVPGDIVLMEAGDLVPADSRLLKSAELSTDEAALTGESVAMRKQHELLDEEGLPVTERSNMTFKGTHVVGGRGTGVVVATGMDTELGRIASLLGATESAKTPLQQRLARFGRRLAFAVLAICAVIFAAGLVRGEPILLMFLTAVSLAVAAVPEALPAVVTVSLALGARQMVRRNALARRLPAVETLGSVTFICADKTGTLTQNRMHAEIFYIDNARQSQLSSASEKAAGPQAGLARSMALCNDASPDAEGIPRGDPTEVAFFEAARDAGFDKATLEQTAPRIDEIPFDATRKRMTTLHRSDGSVVAYTKGAPEQVLPECRDALARTGRGSLDRHAILDEAEGLAREGYRVLAFAFRDWADPPEQLSPQRVETELTFLGLVALIDPPRPEVPDAVDQCRSAGITPVMITGDHPATARAMALRLGIATEEDETVTGKGLAQIPAAELRSHIGRTRVYARVTPDQKIRIVEALQNRGEFVAMTGDGVNDAPALKRADIGVAMGRKGTDVAREAADMVLLDDNFATIVTAVRRGRRIYDNVRKFIKYTMTSNSGEIWTLFLAPFLGLPLPLLPIHILWINLVTDGLPGLALAAEPEERGIMQRPPRPPQESVFAHGMWQHILWIGLLIGGLSLFAQAWSLSNGSEHWQTIVFTVLTLSQLVHALAIRAERDSLLVIGIASNWPLLGALVLTLLLQLATIYVPFLNPIFRTQPLSPEELLLCLTLPWVVLFAVELEKWMARSGWIYQNTG